MATPRTIEVSYEELVDLNKKYGMCLGVLKSLLVNPSVPESVKNNVEKLLSDVV
jgi:hypothetical protein